MSAHVFTGDRTRDKMILALLARFPLPSDIRLAVCGENTLPAFDPASDPPGGTMPNAMIVICGSPDPADGVMWDKIRENIGERLYLLTEPFSIDGFFSVLRHIPHSFFTENNAPDGPEYDSESRTVTRGNCSVTLSVKEAELFELLLSKRGRPVPKDMIYDRLWPRSRETNTADVYISYLRRKLTPILGEGVIVSLRGQGYMLKF